MNTSVTLNTQSDYQVVLLKSFAFKLSSFNSIQQLDPIMGQKLRLLTISKTNYAYTHRNTEDQVTN